MKNILIPFVLSEALHVLACEQAKERRFGAFVKFPSILPPPLGKYLM